MSSRPNERRKVPQRGRGHHPMRQHPLGGSSPQPISVIDMSGAHQHRRQQRQHRTTRPCPIHPATQAQLLIHQLFQTQPVHQRPRS